MSVLVISYSHVDKTIVRAVVSLLKDSHRHARAVYWDGDTEPAEEWREQFKQAIEHAWKACRPTVGRGSRKSFFSSH